MAETHAKVGKITDISIKEGDKDGSSWKMGIFTIDNKFRCSTFNQDIIDNYEVGDEVKAIYEKKNVNGKWYNTLLGFEEVSEADRHSAQKEGVDWIAKEKRIIRQNCNQRAIETLKLMWEIDPEKVKTILKENDENILLLLEIIAKRFENLVWKE